MLALHEATLFYFDLSTEKNQRSGLLNDWAAHVSSKTLSKKGAKASQSKDLSTLHSGITAFSKANTGVTSLSTVEKPHSIFAQPRITLADLDDSVAGIDLLADTVTETQERLAALMSPPKGNKRLTSNVSGHPPTALHAYIFQTIVKIEDNEAPLQSLTGALKKPSKFKNCDLPPGATTGNVWRRNVVPTFIRFSASQPDAWAIKDDDALKAMQLIWDKIYGGRIPHTMVIDDSVFFVVSVNFVPI
jgi:hypothetical protein